MSLVIKGTKGYMDSLELSKETEKWHIDTRPHYEILSLTVNSVLEGLWTPIKIVALPDFFNIFQINRTMIFFYLVNGALKTASGLLYTVQSKH